MPRLITDARRTLTLLFAAVSIPVMTAGANPDSITTSRDCPSRQAQSLQTLLQQFNEDRYQQVVFQARCNRASDSVPNAVDNLLLMALSQQYLGEFTAAGAAIEEIQTSLLDALPESGRQSSLGFDAAINRLRQSIDVTPESLPLRLTQAQFDAHHPKTVMAFHAYGTWLAIEGRYQQAYSIFREGLESLETRNGLDTPGMVPLLEGLADVYLLEMRVPGKSLAALERLLNIVIDHPDEFTTRQQFYARLKLANHLMRFSLERRAQQLYQDAWDFADETERQQMTHQLDLISSQLRKHTEHDLNDTVWFEYRFDLLEDGRPSAVELLDTNAPPIQVSHVRTLMMNTRFRPLFNEGRADVSRQQILKVTFKAIPVPTPVSSG